MQINISIVLAPLDSHPASATGNGVISKSGSLSVTPENTWA
jgi:hypothetical protein